MTHYESLGVDRGATPEEIKRAYRTRASAAHPDRGGSHEEMQRVNRAWEVLGDADRRARYDSTGDDSAQQEPADAARDMLLQLFQQHLDTMPGNFLAAVRADIAKKLKTMEHGLAEYEPAVAGLRARRDAITTKDGAANLAHMVIDQQLQSMAAQRLQVLAGLEIVRAAQALLDAYESSEVMPASMGGLVDRATLEQMLFGAGRGGRRW